MNVYGITKYRNQEGLIKGQEWLAISDIGSTFNGITLTSGTYLKTEDAFVKIIIRILEYMGISCCKIKDIDKMDVIKSRPEIKVSEEVKALYCDRLWDTYDSLRDGQELDLETLEDVIRLQLREDIWSRIYVPYRFKLFIAYDYMVDVETSVHLESILPDLNGMGLYVFPYE